MKSNSIFERMQLGPSQLRSVAVRRFADATALRDTRRNERANGAMYLGGFVVECLLKAKLLEKHSWLRNAAPGANRGKTDQRLWSLCYRQHDLEDILTHLPELTRRLAALETRGQPRLLQNLKSTCASWTIFARYSPISATIDEADEFLDRIKELNPWLQ